MESFDQRGEAANMSMREKSTLKRRINREHNSNFQAGYININEAYLHKTGIRGRKRYFLYCVIVFLVLLAIVNVLLTAGIMYAIKLSHTGVQSMEFLPDTQLLRFLAVTTISSVQMFSGLLGSRFNSSLHVTSHNSKISFHADKSRSSEKDHGTFNMDSKETTFRDVDNFHISLPSAGDIVSPKRVNFGPMKHPQDFKLITSEIEAALITNVAKYERLQLESSYGDVKILGNELVNISTPMRIDSSGRYINLSSLNGGITLNAKQGIYLSPSLPRGVTAAPSQPAAESFMLCVCKNSGKVFAILLTRKGMGCSNADPDNDPCK